MLIPQRSSKHASTKQCVCSIPTLAQQIVFDSEIPKPLAPIASQNHCWFLSVAILQESGGPAAKTSASSCVAPNPLPHGAINTGSSPPRSSLPPISIFSIPLILHFSPSRSCEFVSGPSSRFCACFASIERAARCRIPERPLFLPIAALGTLRLGISCRRKLFKGAAFGRNSSSSEGFSVRAGWEISLKSSLAISFFSWALVRFRVVVTKVWVSSLVVEALRLEISSLKTPEVPVLEGISCQPRGW